MQRNGGGDQLARGAHKAQFRPAEGVSQDKWDSIFEGFDADEFRLKAKQESEQRDRDAQLQADRDASAELGEVVGGL